MNKALTASILAATVFGATAPALADPPRWAPAHGWRAKNGDIRYQQTQNGVRYWQGDDGRYYCRRNDGSTGLIVGAAVGGLLGNALGDGDSGVLSTILGAGVGGALGREIDRGNV